MNPELNNNKKELFAAFFGLFGSLSTLLCCALPALFVALGLGATVAGLTSTLPWLITLSEHKVWLFGFSFSVLLLSAFLLYRSRHAPCPIDPVQRKVCQIGRKLSLTTTAVSFALWAAGFIVAFFPGVLYTFM